MATPHVAVLLAGSGHLDGSEIREAVLALLALDQHGARTQCIAPNADQHHVVDHLTGRESAGQRRNMLSEAGRIARGEVLDLAQAQAADFDALVIPGGFGVAKNLCTFAFKGAQGEVRPDVVAFLKAFLEAGKPVGAICIAPALLAMTLAKLGRKGTLTIGNDEGAAGAIESLGSTHQRHDSPRGIAVDEALNLVTTPAYMFGDARLSDIYTGIERAMAEVVRRVKVPVGA
ncbi:MAG TPA: isoprenoid biosynthesis glyoxalase ElbB [Holophagaceae bacterium]|nr:isoprenoid biosynthesis glyoxalase ElbB [Holophagaceae bacterium]